MKQDLPIHAWDIPQIISTRQVYTGLLNATYIVHTESSLYVLQKIHHAVAMPGSFENYFHVTHFLRERGQATQVLIQTKKGTLWHEENHEGNNDEKWRLLLAVEGEVHTSTTDTELAFESGKLLHSFHNILREYPKPLAEGIKLFRYRPEIEKLQSFREQLANDLDPQINQAAEILLSNLPTLMLPDDLPQQIIHADPKISNFLFTPDKKGICMIDLDTLQKLSPLYDLGDAIRSWCGKEEDNPNNTFSNDIYQSFISGYLNNPNCTLSNYEQSFIPQATKVVMLGLATRFLNDYLENSYFGWDETRYANRKAHNKARCLGQIALYKSAINFI
ncbi:MAG: phosphotransferase [bacterium]|nr:phosphotransferase [bacterium]